MNRHVYAGPCKFKQDFARGRINVHRIIKYSGGFRDPFIDETDATALALLIVQIFPKIKQALL